MTRCEVIEFLNKEFDKIPNRAELSQLSVIQLRKYENNLNFVELRKWMFEPENVLMLSLDEISDIYKFLLYFILDAETNSCFYGNYDLLESQARDAVLELTSKINKYQIVSIGLSGFLEIVKVSNE